MENEERLSPEEFLEVAKQEETAKTQGRLKIFLGMAAGVGKTYAMLEEAQQLKQEGTKLVVGIVETHGREDTSSLLQGLEVVPRKEVIYKGKVFQELDLDTIIELKPPLVLIDELAHSNVTGLRHPKRWQDVMEILDNGIDVYTTLNVQHIESLNDIVSGITGIPIRETVPDLIIETASSIRLVDLTPEELLQRLREGKVYLEEQSKIATLHFFQKDKLTALREMALRYAAEKVDRDLHGMLSTTDKAGDWRPREKLMVAVDSSPYSQKLIRTTRRLAAQVDAPWIAVYVNDGTPLSEEENNQLSKNLSLARDLGAEVITTNDPDIVAGLQRIARQRGLTQMIVGRPPKRSFLGIFQKISLVDRLARECRDIDVHVIRQESSIITRNKKLVAFSKEPHFLPYALVTLSVLLLTVANWLILPFIGYKVVGVIFLMGILFLSLFFRKGPIFLASILYALIWNFLFIPTEGEFEMASNEDTALVSLYFLTAIATGILVDRAREHKEILSKRERSAQALYDIIRQITSAPSTLEVVKLVKERLDKLFNGTFEILPKDRDEGSLDFSSTPLLADEKERNAALWAFENGKEAGWSTDTLPSAQNLYIPLKGYQEVVGLLVYHPKVNRLLTIEEINFLHTVCQQLTTHLEHTFSSEQAKQKELLKEIEKIQNTILRRISHEFESPLMVTKNAVKALKDKLEVTEERSKIQELDEIEHSSEGLTKILSNISAMAQLSAGTISLNKSAHPVDKLIHICCEDFRKSFSSHQIKTRIEENLPQLVFDFHLIELLLYNLICNAIEYSPPQSTIEVEAIRRDRFLVISVADEGKGVPEPLLDLIFEQFYRTSDATTPGVGLGLSIAKTIAELHNGSLKVENRPTGGAKFSLSLPIETPL